MDKGEMWTSGTSVVGQHGQVRLFDLKVLEIWFRGACGKNCLATSRVK